MFFDWLAREGGIFIGWWLLATLAGLAVLPLCLRLLSGLPDKGYTFARSIGILLTAFVFWLLANLGFLQNNTGSMVVAWLIVMSVSLLAYFRMGEPIHWRAYWQENKRVIILGEILFISLFFTWTVFRAFANDTATTEKPMDLMFISSIMRSTSFPPNDAWMAGYSISYYHFGYVMSAMLSKLSNVTSTIGFSMTVALWLAMAGTNAFGVAYNLVRSRAYHNEELQTDTHNRTTPLLMGLLATVFIVFLSNFQFPLIELPWQSGVGNAEYYQYWATQARNEAPPTRPENFSSTPESWDYWWWFRASRVLTDFQLDGSSPPSWFAQPIDEFPSFSFLLGDSHPHVLALPFGLMALGLALHVLLAKRNPTVFDLIFFGITIGAFLFLNTWDILAYFGAFVGADALRRIMRNDNGRLSLVDLVSLVGDVVFFLLVAVLSYGLFLYSFRSQAGGITINLLYPTYFPHFFLMFAPFFVLISGFVIAEIWRGRQHKRMNWGWGFGVILGVFAVIGVIFLVFLIRMASDPTVAKLTQDFINEAGGVNAVMPLLIQRRLTYLPVTLLMVITIVIIVARLFPRLATVRDNANIPNVTYSKASAFALLLVGLGSVLVLLPEYIYLVDVFSSRINTIFKFYYQVWVVWGIAGVFAVFSLVADSFALRPSRPVRYFVSGTVVLILIMGMLYPILGMYSRMFVEPMQGFTIATRLVTLDATTRTDLPIGDWQTVQANETFSVGDTPITVQTDGFLRIFRDAIWLIPEPTLDGGKYMIPSDDYAMVRCLADLVPDDKSVVVEATRDAYNPQYGRIASITGIPVVIGWANHERQWRGTTYPAIGGTRESDVEKIYNNNFWEDITDLVAKYSVDYIVYGNTERNQYELSGEQKFVDNLGVVCQFGDSKVYVVGEG